MSNIYTTIAYQELDKAHLIFIEDPTEESYMKMCFAIIRACDSKLHSFASGRQRNPAVAEEIVTKTYECLLHLNNKNAFKKKPFDFFSYLRKIFIREESRALKLRLLGSDNDLEQFADVSDVVDPFELILKKLQTQADLSPDNLGKFIVSKGIMTLRQWEVFKLREVDNLDYKSIAIKLKITAETARQHQCAAHKAVLDKANQKMLFKYLEDFN